MSSVDVKSVGKNHRNGYSKKTVKSELGEVEIKVSRCRKDEYEPQIISDYNRNADGTEEKIIGLYARGISRRDILEISAELVSKISEKVIPEVTARQNRPLGAVYPFVFLDVIHYKVRVL